MALCDARRLDSGPNNFVYWKGTLSTCFTDTVLLPIWPLLLLLCLLALFTLRREQAFSADETYASPVPPSSAIAMNNLGAKAAGGTMARMGFQGGRAQRQLSPDGAVKRRRLLLALYLFFLVANAGMTTLVIVRLSVAQRGIGLLPCLYIGFLFGGLSLFFRPHSGLLTLLFSLYWLAMTICLGVRTNSVNVMSNPKNVKNPLQTRSYATYGLGDELLDFAVMTGVSGLLFALELLQSATDRMAQ